mmetsp:Transcript_856/g.980  ORF Transcript_856/g.980 Transcript_856/m.980 type:complete len:121 (-) Transcript_856:175-537(-)
MAKSKRTKIISSVMKNLIKHHNTSMNMTTICHKKAHNHYKYTRYDKEANEEVEFESINIDQRIIFSSIEGYCFHKLGSAYHSLEEYDMAIEKYQAALCIARDIGDRSLECECLRCLSAIS